MKYTVDNPPRAWANYPKSYLKEAISILDSYKGNWALANKWLRESGLRQIMEDGGCPEIELLKAEKLGPGETQITYEIKGKKEHDYFIGLALYSGSKFIRTIMYGTKQLRSSGVIKTEEDITQVRLTVRLVGYDNVETFKQIPVSTDNRGETPKLMD